MKVFTLILQFYANLMGSGLEYIDKVLRETSLLNLFLVFNSQQDLILHDETTEAVSRMMKTLVQQKDFSKVEEESDDEEEESKTAEDHDEEKTLVKTIISISQRILA